MHATAKAAGVPWPHRISAASRVRGRSAQGEWDMSRRHTLSALAAVLTANVSMALAVSPAIASPAPEPSDPPGPVATCPTRIDQVARALRAQGLPPPQQRTSPCSSRRTAGPTSNPPTPAQRRRPSHPQTQDPDPRPPGDSDARTARRPRGLVRRGLRVRAGGLSRRDMATTVDRHGRDVVLTDCSQHVGNRRLETRPDDSAAASRLRR
jgi:hypothetical protein